MYFIWICFCISLKKPCFLFTQWEENITWRRHIRLVKVFGESKSLYKLERRIYKNSSQCIVLLNRWTRNQCWYPWCFITVTNVHNRQWRSKTENKVIIPYALRNIYLWIPIQIMKRGETSGLIQGNLRHNTNLVEKVIWGWNLSFKILS